MSANADNPKPSALVDFYAKNYAGLEFDRLETAAAAQDKLLAAHLTYAAGHSPFYREMFAREGLDARNMRGVADLYKIPCTTKEDLTRRNDDFLACPSEDITDVCLTSATTGDTPNALLQTSSDLSRLAYNEEAAFRMIGIGPGDTVIVCAALDRCFMAGLAYYLGGLKVGARMVRAGAGSAAQHWHLLKGGGATVIIGVPSLIRKIGQYAIENGDDPKGANIRKIVAIGEAIRGPDMALAPGARALEEMWAATVYSTYASTEMATTFCDCQQRQGGHLRPELVVAEILDANGSPVPLGQTGELVVTPLGVTGMPLIRFRTGDITFMLAGQCGCGRTSPRLGAVLGRTNQMLKVKGTTVFPSFLISVVEGMDGVAGAYVEATKKEDGNDNILLYVALADPSLSREAIADYLRARARVAPEIIIIAEELYLSKTLAPGKRKRATFFDLR
jgi:phenylacetate-CoA ligase